MKLETEKKADYLPKSFSPIVGQQIDSVAAAATHKKRLRGGDGGGDDDDYSGQQLCPLAMQQSFDQHHICVRRIFFKCLSLTLFVVTLLHVHTHTSICICS